ncbi:MAG: FtsX-like permease family protein, partial [Streptosporangiaceae bacterium]
TIERRRQIRLLSRIGATTSQLAALFRWQALFVAVTGITAGAAVCAGTLAGMDRAVTGTAVPYIPAAPAALIVTAVAALGYGTIMATFTAISRRAELS